MTVVPWVRLAVCALVLGSLILASDESKAIDPKFELDLKALRPGGNASRKDTRAIDGKRQTAAGNVAKEAPRGNSSPAAPGKTARTPVSAAAAGKADKHPGRIARRSGNRHHRKGKALALKRRLRGNGPLDRSHSLNLSLGLPRAAAADAERGERITQARGVWDRIMPAGAETADRNLSLTDDGFSLALDPASYPVFPGMDGRRIIVDAYGTLSPLVKSIIEQKDGSTHFVTADPKDPVRFYSSLLTAARFYSVEENFGFSFGSDPRITVNSDFKVEKSRDSLLHNDVILLNVSPRRGDYPPALRTFLKGEGFDVVDLAAQSAQGTDRKANVLYGVKGGDQRAAVDAVLAAAGIGPEKDREIRLDDGSSSGVHLSVKADRYFVEGGRKVAVSFSRDDKLQKALLMLLQLKGYHVVPILPEDGFGQIAGKLAQVMKQPVRYGMHELGQKGPAPFAVRMSGVTIPRGGNGGGIAFVTDVGIDPLTRELLGSMGYDVLTK